MKQKDVKSVHGETVIKGKILTNRLKIRDVILEKIEFE